MGRLSLAKLSQEDQFEVAETAQQLGFWILVGEAFFIEHPEYTPDWNFVHRIRREFDPAFVPVVCVQQWQAPTGETKRVVRFMAGRHVLNPKEGAEPLPIRFPSHPVGGVLWRGPVLEAALYETAPVVDEVEAKVTAASEGMLRKTFGGFVPLDHRVYETMAAQAKQAREMSNASTSAGAPSKGAIALKNQIVDAQVGSRERAAAAHKADLRDALKDNWKRMERIRKAETQYDRDLAMARAIEAQKRRPFVSVGRA